MPEPRDLIQAALSRRLLRRSAATGQISLPAVPSLLEDYVTMANDIFASIGRRFTDEEVGRLRSAIQGQVAEAFQASPRSTIVISWETAVGAALHYRVRASWWSVENAYENWIETREPPLFGTHPDARVIALAEEATRPQSCRVLDIGAGTGRNALPLARRGHPVDVVELTPAFAESIRSIAADEDLDVRVIQRDVFADADDLRDDYGIIVVSEVVPDFRTTAQLCQLFTLADRALGPEGRLVLNMFLTRADDIPSDAARELGQQCYSNMFARSELTTATAGLNLTLVSDDAVLDYERSHLPDDAWPPTGWYENWARGVDVFDIAPEDSPIELRWLVYQKGARGR